MQEGTAVHKWLEKRPGFHKSPTLKLKFAGWDLTGHIDDYTTNRGKKIFIEYKTSPNISSFNAMARLQLRIYAFIGVKTGIGLDYGILVHLDKKGVIVSRQSVTLPYNFDDTLQEIIHSLQTGKFKRPMDWKCEGCWEGFKERCRFQQST